MYFDIPLEALRYHVTGAIERGKATPIVEITERTDEPRLWAEYLAASDAHDALMAKRNEAQEALKAAQLAVDISVDTMDALYSRWEAAANAKVGSK